ncbi:DNA/RNA nuclease SfsA [Puniceibacterium sediminis]|uniref:Sugar fermentation stimulation protein homolog n=1 Tax=Puniceibacterium sediminis TaxID=1608407 RepID=A0A238WS24_9RHOB|nr:DNA/RNA nuclease SfsA [Puniceibacterium sediminis]SNR49208.1 sugar fermentation stimulation protein A [Puniceibacterium sediminis]
MRFQTPLIPAVLIRRYKRFLADVRLMDGQEVTAHCPNPGSMMGLADPGLPVWLEPNDDPKKKLKYGLRLIEVDDALVGVDTGAANRVLRESLNVGEIPGLTGYDRVLPEQKYGTGSRIDFLLQGAGRRDAYVEVKSVTLSRRPGLAEFPDSVTARGTKHLGELAAMVDRGHRAVLVYLVQRTDCATVSVAADIDPAYAAAFATAKEAGVEVLCLSCAISSERIDVLGTLPYETAPAGRR